MTSETHRVVDGPDALVTKPEQIRAGFIALALERNGKASPFIEQARVLYAVALKCANPVDLLNLNDYRKALLAAAGVSDKSAQYFDEAAKNEAITNFIATFLEPEGDKFAEELVYRFLLTKGDTVGGSMRNLAGELGERKFTRAFAAALQLKEIPFSYFYRKGKTWVKSDILKTGQEIDAKGITWDSGDRPRTLIYNLRVPVSNVNVDLSLFRCGPESWSNNMSQPSQYIALGEIKGGIDPAGAFEHWSTSRTAISTSRAKFAAQECHPKTFFAGAAITVKVAGQIWDFLQNDTLTKAANLTDPNQLGQLCDWLTSL